MMIAKLQVVRVGGRNKRGEEDKLYVDAARIVRKGSARLKSRKNTGREERIKSVGSRSRRG